MNWLTKKIIFIKTGLFLGAILFFLSCRKEENKIGFNNGGQLPSYTHFTDTITVKSEVVQISEYISTTNITEGGNTSYMLAGAYTDPIFGKVATEAYTQLDLVNQFTELPAATADSAFLYLNYSYYYGTTSQAQTLNIYKLTGSIEPGIPYYSDSPGISYDPIAIGTITFNASTDSTSGIVIRITDIPFLQSILEGSKNNSDFISRFPGIAIVPANNTDGAIIRIDGGSVNSVFRIHYTQYGSNKAYELRFGKSTKKFFRVSADRTGTELAALNSNYGEVSSASLNNRCYVQALTGIRTKISFPYLSILRDSFPNMAMNEARLFIVADPATNTANFPVNTGLYLFRTENNKIMKDDNGNDFQIQPNNNSQTSNSIISKYSPSETNGYAFTLRSYFQAIMLDQIPNDPIIISPHQIGYSVNRLVFNDNANAGGPAKLNLYFTTTK